MPATPRLVRVSKYLAFHLRHHPEQHGLTFAEGGGVDVDALLAACKRQGFAFTRGEQDRVVRTTGKQRFSFDPTGPPSRTPIARR